MLSLVLVLCLLLFLVMAVITIGTVNLRAVEVKQTAMIESIAKAFGTQTQRYNKSYVLPIRQDGKEFMIRIDNELDAQKFTFSDRLLFLTDDYHLNSEGEDTLRIVGSTILSQIHNIKEIQIQGHADIRRSRRYPADTGNTELAAMRALAVFKFFQDPADVGIDPAKNLMSVTSFGEFLPVQRIRSEANYNNERLGADNADEGLMNQNRRIEILLYYRQ